MKCTNEHPADPHRCRGEPHLGGRREPFAYGARGGKNVLERFDGLGVAAGLQTAVRVDPELACEDRRERRLQQSRDFGDTWHPGRVDVVNTRSNAVVEAACPNVCDDLHARSGGLRSAISSRSATATWRAVSPGGWSSRTNDHARIVTGPVSMPLTGLAVRLCAYLDQSTVIGLGRDTSPQRIDGRVHRVP